jgi:tRNA pseudouridine55 synthase
MNKEVDKSLLSSIVQTQAEGILLVDKPPGVTSFSVIAKMRKVFGVKTIGHAGTLDPFATGVLVILIGRAFTRLQDSFLAKEKEYRALVLFGQSTDTFDCDGEVVAVSDRIPSRAEVEEALAAFQGTIEQVPPMYSAKKIAGKRLYDLARQGKVVERKPCKVEVHIEMIRYQYPELELVITSSKGTYIRSLAHDIGKKLGIEAHLHALRRVRSGHYSIDECVALSEITSATPLIRQLPCT